MKITYCSLFVTLLVAVSFVGCTKEPAAKTTAGHYLSASSGTIGSFSATGTEVSAGGATGAKISISAETSSGTSITLYLNPYGGVTGVYPISGGPTAGGVYRAASGGTTVSSTSGNITLTAVTPDIVGTFSYTASDGSTFTGSFNVAAP